MEANPTLKLSLLLIKLSGQNMENSGFLPKFVTSLTCVTFIIGATLAALAPIYNFNALTFPDSMDCFTCYIAVSGWKEVLKYLLKINCYVMCIGVNQHFLMQIYCLRKKTEFFLKN